MSGFLTNAQPALAIVTGLEELPLDSRASSGAMPQQEKLALYKLALVMTALQNSLSKTMVAGTFYYSQYIIGVTYTPTPRGSAISEASFSVTGVNVPVGATGGTDTFHVWVWNSAGVVVGRSATAGVTAGTALTNQQIPLYQPDGSTAGPITLTSGTYYLGLQSNGTTANFRTINYPTWPLNTGSQTGTAGTSAAISAIASTFTANLGPQLSLY